MKRPWPLMPAYLPVPLLILYVPRWWTAPAQVLLLKCWRLWVFLCVTRKLPPGKVKVSLVLLVALSGGGLDR